MDIEKIVKIYSIIAKSEIELTKLAIKNESGYSMTTVIKTVDFLEKNGLIINNEKVSVKGGKPHSGIKANKKFVFAVFSHENGYLSLTVFTPDLIVAKTEALSLAKFESFEEPALILLSTLMDYKTAAVALTFRLRDFALFRELINQKMNIPICSLDKCDAIYYYSKYVLNNNDMLFARTLDDKMIITYRNKEHCTSERFDLVSSENLLIALSRFINSSPLSSETLPIKSDYKLIDINAVKLGSAACLFENYLSDAVKACD